MQSPTRSTASSFRQPRQLAGIRLADRTTADGVANRHWIPEHITHPVRQSATVGAFA